MHPHGLSMLLANKPGSNSKNDFTILRYCPWARATCQKWHAAFASCLHTGYIKTFLQAPIRMAPRKRYLLQFPTYLTHLSLRRSCSACKTMQDKELLTSHNISFVSDGLFYPINSSGSVISHRTLFDALAEMRTCLALHTIQLSLIIYFAATGSRFHFGRLLHTPTREGRLLRLPSKVSVLLRDHSGERPAKIFRPMLPTVCHTSIRRLSN